ncbi:MAG: type II toxin-antitoxin system Phd/YefM family antitoxin [Agathobaculum sp.]|uniref:type II toxin-antitoxin system Phd/YefM family antitoxin n=1 Tax=Agathobaculum sp. TaxID=2048138 RepID=UPI0025BC6395|nr:type II toxin-antitoxin system Phd/YefM family antitoxin [Agathobaculum sp.]MCI7125785.1 type II toxin-antitoxin system Phd/YefM family antitoxin [Agathobaculum sp.]MDY3711391.1 type II toxin-antitoxin system Phd/YefM family antitoxin [Agathobaculum sp.]
MPTIRPSSDLRNGYNEISEFCHKHREPVYLTKNGVGDLAVMSIETYEMLVGKFELYHMLEKSLREIEQGDGISLDEAFDKIESRLADDAV